MAAETLLVTGGSGIVGQFVVDHCLCHHPRLRITNVDIKPPLPQHAAEPNVSFIQASITDLEPIRAAMAGQHRVIHLGAFNDGDAPEEELYQSVNTVGAWNVLVAAEEAGCQRVAVASSIAAIGEHYGGPGDDTPMYLPIDEEHPCIPKGGYGVSCAGHLAGPCLAICQCQCPVLSGRRQRQHKLPVNS
jgi:nucleoside-diphosphate-sugar epimerase